MKKYGSLLVVLLLALSLIGCQEKTTTTSQEPATTEKEDAETPSLPEELDEKDLVKIVAQNLGVPEDVEYTYEVGYTTFWNAEQRYYRNVNFFVDGESVAFASVDPANGKLLKDAVAYGEEAPVILDKGYLSFSNSFVRTEKKDKNYTIATSFDYAGYYYNIFDNAGNLLDDGFHDYRGSFEIQDLGTLYMLMYGFGGTNVQPNYRFYDVENGLVSRWFSGPVAVWEDRLAYFRLDFDNDIATLVVQDAFNTEKYYQEFVVNFNTNIGLKFWEMGFSPDGLTLWVEYCEDGNEENILKEEFILGQEDSTAKPKPAKEMKREELAKVVAKNLDVPEGLNYTYEIGGLFYWDAGEIWLRHVVIYAEDGGSATAAVDPTTGKLIKSILNYEKSE